MGTESGNMPVGRQEWITNQRGPLRFSNKVRYFLVQFLAMHAVAQALGFDVGGIFPVPGITPAFLDEDDVVVHIVGDDGFLLKTLRKKMPGEVVKPDVEFFLVVIFQKTFHFVVQAQDIDKVVADFPKARRRAEQYNFVNLVVWIFVQVVGYRGTANGVSNERFWIVFLRQYVDEFGIAMMVLPSGFR